MQSLINKNKIKEQVLVIFSKKIMKISKNLKKKLDSLISLLKGKNIIVAFSGGIDSSLLAYISSKYAKNTLLLTEKSILTPSNEIEETIKFAQKYNIMHLILEGNPLKNDKFIENPTNRCYICKKDIFSKFVKIKEKKNFDLIIDGSNLDDISEYRPGMKALQEFNIISPYIELNINKQEIRELSNHFGLETSIKPSNACLASRIPYNEEINEKKLQMVHQAEDFLKHKFNLRQLRVRFHDRNLARIELLKEDFTRILTKKNFNLISSTFKEIGFTYITIDIEGFRSGSMDEIFKL